MFYWLFQEYGNSVYHVFPNFKIVSVNLWNNRRLELSHSHFPAPRIYRYRHVVKAQGVHLGYTSQEV